MAIFTTLFAADEDELSKLFPHWFVPRTEPHTKKGRNPFTGKEIDVFMWVPDEVAEVALTTTEPPGARLPIAPKGSKPIPPVVAAENDYDTDLENNVAPLGLRTVPHFVMKGYVVLAPLAKLLGAEGPTRPARVSGTGTAIECMPDPATLRLASTAEAELAAIANVWARTDETAELDKTKALWVLTRAHALAKVATESKRRLCVFVQV
jgi:hypothetical protein